LPAVLTPFVIGFLALQGESAAIGSLPFLYFGPLLWGGWNILFLTTRQYVPIQSRNTKIGVYGAVYGLISALLNSFFFEFTAVINSFSDSLIAVAIIVYPVILYLVWKYIVNALNLYFDVY